MRRFIKRTIVLFLYWSGLNEAAGLFLRRRAYLVGYHSIVKDKEAAERKFYAKVTLLEKQFENHLSFLKNKGHNFISISDLPGALEKGIAKPTAIFFDDGFKNNLTVALPLLKKYEVPFNIFITTQYIDHSEIPLGADNQKHPELFMDWEDVAVLKREGAAIGSHGLSHAKLTDCRIETLRAELSDSKRIISQRAGGEVNFFSYPSGRFDRRVVKEAKNSGYKLAVTTVEGIIHEEKIKNESLSLPRIAPKPYDDLLMFKVKVYSWNIVKALERLLW